MSDNNAKTGSTTTPLVDIDSNNEEALEQLPKIKDVQTSEKLNLALRKLKFCCQTKLLHNPLAQSCSRETRCFYVEELIDYLGTTRGALCDGIYSDLFAMIGTNLDEDFHDANDEENCEEWEDSFPEAGVDGREDGSSKSQFQQADPQTESATEGHYQRLVCELFLVALESAEFRVTLAKPYLDQPFVAQLVHILTNSPKRRVRGCLECVLRRIYAKFVRFRPFLRKLIAHCLLEAVFDEGSQLATTNTFHGLGELLGVLEEIVNGFKVPLKNDDRQLLLKILLPLHRLQKIGKFHKKLSDRILQFLELDPSLAKATILSLLKYWPKTSGAKEVIFVEELEMVMSVIEHKIFKELATPISNQFAKCISSQHFQVQMKILNCWKNEQCLTLIQQNNVQFIEALFAPLDNAIKNHWNAKIRSMAKQVQNTLMGLNWKVYNAMAAKTKGE